MGFLSWFFDQFTVKSEQKIHFKGPGTFSEHIVGESHYQENLSLVCGGYTEDGVEVTTNAELVYEDTNAYDKNAIKVEISGHTVGYLSRADAIYYRNRMRDNGYAGLTAICKAKIKGGWNRGDDDIGDFGVTLDLPHNFIEFLNNSIPANEICEQPIEDNTLILEVDKCQPDVLAECRVGDYVNFWWPEDDPHKIYIFSRGSCGGGGRIGFVPEKYTHIILSHITNGMKFETEIIGIYNDNCNIKYRLLSKEDTKHRNAQEKEDIRNELTKKYTPKKPIELIFNANDIIRLKVGEKLYIEFDALDDYIQLLYYWQIKFVNQKGDIVGIKSDEKSVIQRILKAHFNSFLFDIEVISTREKHNWYTNPVRVSLKPYKK